jgi:plasmid stability protein
MLAERQQQQQNACMVSITIRDVPQETRNELAARAARSGRSLQEYLRGELVALSHRPDPAAVMEGIRRRVEKAATRISIDDLLDAKDADRR